MLQDYVLIDYVFFWGNHVTLIRITGIGLIFLAFNAHCFNSIRVCPIDQWKCRNTILRCHAPALTSEKASEVVYSARGFGYELGANEMYNFSHLYFGRGVVEGLFDSHEVGTAQASSALFGRQIETDAIFNCSALSYISWEKKKISLVHYEYGISPDILDKVLTLVGNPIQSAEDRKGEIIFQTSSFETPEFLNQLCYFSQKYLHVANITVFTDPNILSANGFLFGSNSIGKVNLIHYSERAGKFTFTNMKKYVFEEGTGVEVDRDNFSEEVYNRQFHSLESLGQEMADRLKRTLYLGL